MPKKVFISFRYEDTNFKDNLLNLFAASRGPIQATPCWIKQSPTRLTASAIDDEIRRQMEGCVGMIVVVGDNVHSSEWVERELELAGTVHGMRKSQCLFVRHPQSRGGVNPRFKSFQVIMWDPQAIAEIVAAWQ